MCILCISVSICVCVCVCVHVRVWVLAGVSKCHAWWPPKLLRKPARTHTHARTHAHTENISTHETHKCTPAEGTSPQYVSVGDCDSTAQHMIVLFCVLRCTRTHIYTHTCATRTHVGNRTHIYTHAPPLMKRNVWTHPYFDPHTTHGMIQ